VRTFGLTFLVLAASLALGTTVASGAARVVPPTQIQLISVTVSEKENDVGPKGPSKGDRTYGVSMLLNAVPQFGRKRGVEVGDDKGWFTLTSKTTAVASGITRLPGGTLTFKGAVKVVQGLMTVPVVAGTGLFRGARGTLYVGSTGRKGEAINIYRLTYAPIA
jgi:hypothetical protein